MLQQLLLRMLMLFLLKLKSILTMLKQNLILPNQNSTLQALLTQRLLLNYLKLKLITIKPEMIELMLKMPTTLPGITFKLLRLILIKPITDSLKLNKTLRMLDML
jgi:hypothetical protein